MYSGSHPHRSEGDFALVMGIDHYPEFRCLGSPRRDAKAFADWLTDPEGGGLEPDHCIEIYSPIGPLPPGHKHIDDDPRIPHLNEIDFACQRIFRGKRRLGPGGRLYVYFSGHGLALAEDGDVGLCLCPWSEGFFRNCALSSVKLRQNMIEWGLFDAVILFFDCCRVRSGYVPGLAPGFRLPAPVQRPSKTEYLVGYATEPLDAAFESYDGSHSHFSRALLEGLRGGAARESGGVTAADLIKYLEFRTPSIANEHGSGQRPEFVSNINGSGHDEMTFGRARPQLEVRITVAGGRKPPIILEGPRTETIEVWETRPTGAPVGLLAGRHYLLRDQDGWMKTFFAAWTKGGLDVQC